MEEMQKKKRRTNCEISKRKNQRKGSSDRESGQEKHNCGNRL